MTLAVCSQLFLYCVSVIFSIASANEESVTSSVTINRPIPKTSKPWHFSTDYVRCFCNLPSCVTTGYMCKSSDGGCFSEVAERPASVYRGRHGCLELLDEKDQQSRCHRRGGANDRTTIRRKENTKSLLICCHHDMCNHVESPQTKNLINHTLLDDANQDTANRYQQQDSFLYSDSDVWFRAATIAVPICGAVILFVLIALAVKILKNEHQSSTTHKLGPTMYVHAMPQQAKTVKDKYRHDNFDRTYDNLLSKGIVATHHHPFYPSPNKGYQRPNQMPLLEKSEARIGADKNTTNARYNFMNLDVDPGTSIVLDIEKKQSACSEVNMVNSDVKCTGDDGKFYAGKTFVS